MRPVLLGESIAPYRIIRSSEAVVPVTEQGVVLTAESAANRGLSDLHGWLTKAEQTWDLHNQSSRALAEQLNYINQLSAQFPISSFRIAYAKAGIFPAACIVRNPRAVIDHKLYWMAPTTETEGTYLVAILNSETARSRIAKFQSRGQWGARDFDKVAFNLPIPRFDHGSSLHRELAAAAEEAERIAGHVELLENIRFQRARSLVRAALADSGIAHRIDALVARLLDGD